MIEDVIHCDDRRKSIYKVKLRKIMFESCVRSLSRLIISKSTYAAHLAQNLWVMFFKAETKPWAVFSHCCSITSCFTLCILSLLSYYHMLHAIIYISIILFLPSTHPCFCIIIFPTISSQPFFLFPFPLHH